MITYKNIRVKSLKIEEYFVVKMHKKYYYKEWQVSCTKMKERKLDVYFNI